MTNDPNVDVQDIEVLLDGFFRVELISLRHRRFDGAWSPRLERFVLDRPDAACAMVYNEDNDAVYFVRQFRPGVFRKEHGWTTELAAGLLDPGETPEQALAREIHEELGFDIRKFEHLDTFFSSPGIISERIYMYLVTVSNADRVNDGGGADEEHEDIQILEVPIQQLDQFLADNRINDAKTLLGILRFRERIRS